MGYEIFYYIDENQDGLWTRNEYSSYKYDFLNASFEQFAVKCNSKVKYFSLEQIKNDLHCRNLNWKCTAADEYFPYGTSWVNEHSKDTFVKMMEKNHEKEIEDILEFFKM